MGSKHIGEKLSMLADNLDIRQTALAEKVGVTPSTINRFFNGKRDIHGSALLSILKELGIDIDQLVSKKIKTLNDLENDPSNASEALSCLYEELNDLGKQSILNQMLWAAKLARGESFPKKLEENIKKEINLI